MRFLGSTLVNEGPTRPHANRNLKYFLAFDKLSVVVIVLLLVFFKYFAVMSQLLVDAGTSACAALVATTDSTLCFSRSIVRSLLLYL